MSTPSTSTRSVANITGTPAGTIMPESYVQTVGSFAYIWGWPLVNNFNRAAATHAPLMARCAFRLRAETETTAKSNRKRSHQNEITK